MLKSIKRKIRKLPPRPPEEEVNGEKLPPKLELDKLFISRKIEQTEVRTMAFRLDLARIRGDVIDKKVVEKQLAYILIAMRQQILAIPTSYARKLLHKDDVKEVYKILEEMCHRILLDIKDLPKKAVDPSWLDELED
jgi:hypothetical protein